MDPNMVEIMSLEFISRSPGSSGAVKEGWTKNKDPQMNTLGEIGCLTPDQHGIHSSLVRNKPDLKVSVWSD